MKKIVTVIIALLSVTVLFASCGKKSQNAELAEQLINNIGNNITLDSADAIKEAQANFDVLTDADKAQVKNKKKLEKAAEELAALEEFGHDVEAILNAANPGFSKSDENMTDLISKYDDIKNEYKKMSKENKEYFKEDFDKLEVAVEKLKEYGESAIAPAAAYVKAFNDTYKGKNYTVIKLGCIKQIRGDSEYHFFALTYKDEKGEEKNVYSTARFSGPEAYATIMSRPDLFFADKPVSKDYDALENSNTSLDVAEILKAANTLQVAPPVTVPEETTTKKSSKKDAETTTKKNSDKKEKTTAVETTVKDAAQTTAD